MLILTNNPLVQAKLSDRQHVVNYYPVSFRELLVLVRDRVHLGYQLYTHPLSGSVKPNETKYKSVGLGDKPKISVCRDSLMLIEEAIMAFDRFSPRGTVITPQMDADFQLVDWTLIQSALSSAYTMHGIT